MLSIFPGAKKNKQLEEINKIKQGLHGSEVGRTGEPLEPTKKEIEEKKARLSYLQEIQKATRGCQNAKNDHFSKAATKIGSVVGAEIKDVQRWMKIKDFTEKDIEKIDKFNVKTSTKDSRNKFIEKYGFLIKTPKMEGVSWSEERVIKNAIEAIDVSGRTSRAIVQDIVNKTKENGIDLLKSNK